MTSDYHARTQRTSRAAPRSRDRCQHACAHHGALPPPQASRAALETVDRYPLDSSSQPAVERASLDRSPQSTAVERASLDHSTAVERASLDRYPHSTAFERQAQDALYRAEEARREQAAGEATRRAERARASLGAAQLRDETGRAEVVAELELIFPTASRVRIERALDAAIQIGGDRNEAALLLLEPDEV